MAASKLHIICVGAVYIDTIWTVPHFPREDTKLRAQAVTRRRGGNTANTLQVLSDILAHDPATQPASTKLHLIAVLPEEDSQDGQYIKASIPEVDLTSSFFRRGHHHAASSMIIQSQRDNTRTIVSHGGGLPEMTCKEFIENFQSIMSNERAKGKVWIHFEGRIPDITSDCVMVLRSMYGAKDLKISVECEKPDRRGLDFAAERADVVFYSKFQILVCTWGAKGAAAVKLGDTPDEDEWAECEDTWCPPGLQDAKVVDTVGAGDTFIAGMLHQLTQHSNSTLEDKVCYAVQLSSRKVFQDGFGGLGAAMYQSSS
ncbi:Ribokinase-like protein [Ampelomyces quisqualis]|uniref:Ribokinase-like protein n=1 Tax=Ampelomyces quisqualis TaxID=50730 RepID=A0A6A5QD16_AMPQU|nr:Ribokinase-like protein [Ampelomyces quisqualis]